MIMLQVINS